MKMDSKIKYWTEAGDRLESLGFNDADVNSIMGPYMEDHRFYHTFDHIIDLLYKADQAGALGDDALFLAIMFHDVVYNPKEYDNEKQSADLFLKMYSGDRRDEIAQAILDTKTHVPSNLISEALCRLDLGVLRGSFSELIEYEHKIFKEYQFVDYKIYKEERIKALKSFHEEADLQHLISYVDSRKPNIGLYCGSFNPFHKGHYSVLLKAEEIFDKVIIAQGKNVDKTNELYELPKKLHFRQIEIYNGLLSDFINRLGYDVTLIRGIRNSTDLQYEMTQYRFLQDLKPDLKMVSIFCDAPYEHVSSSAIRQLEKFNKHEKYLI